MKKILAIVCTLSLVLGMSTMALAASIPENGTNQDKTMTTDAPTYTSPVYGYIGPDANIEDENPTDPDAPPTIDPQATDMALSVPVKLMWAAFASGGGSIASPAYTIENKSAFAIDVVMTSFTQTDAVNVSGLTLNLVGNGSNGITAANDILNASNLPLGTLDAANGTAPARGFKIGGTYNGNFGTAQQPKYDMLLTFAIK